MSGRITGYTEVRELDYRLAERTVLAIHDATGDEVVIRYLSEDVHIGQLREQVVRLSTVESRHVVRAREVVVAESGAAVVLESVGGISLRALLAEQGVVTMEAALLVLRGSLHGLAAAHAAAVVHTACRPEAMLIDVDGEIRLHDFGVRQVAAAAGGPAEWPISDRAGRSVDTATADIHAAIASFVEILTGITVLTIDVDLLVEAVPVALRDLVRAGLSGSVDVVALLASLDTIAVAGCGTAWAERGRLWLALRAEEMRVEELRAQAALVGEYDSGEAEAVGAAGVVGLLGAHELRLQSLRAEELRERAARLEQLRAAAVLAEQQRADEMGAGVVGAVSEVMEQTGAEMGGIGTVGMASSGAAGSGTVGTAGVGTVGSGTVGMAGSGRGQVGKAPEEERRRRSLLIVVGVIALVLICGGFLTWLNIHKQTPTVTPEVPTAGSPTVSPSSAPVVPPVGPSASPSPVTSPSRTPTTPVRPPAPTDTGSPYPKGLSEGGLSPTPSPAPTSPGPGPSTDPPSATASPGPTPAA